MTIEDLKLENQICFPLYVVSRLVTKLYQPILAEFDLTYPQYLVFLLLWEKDNRSVSDIGNCLFLESNTLTPLLKRLELKGYIMRQRSAKDERSVFIKLTPAGKDLQEKAMLIPDEIVNGLKSDEISIDEVIVLKNTLQKMIQTLQ